MAEREIKENCFNLLWKIKNFSYCLQKKAKQITSPAFVVDAIEKTKWTIWLYPGGTRDENYIACFLKRESDSEGADTVEIKYDLAFVSKDGVALKSLNNIVENVFKKGAAFGLHNFQMREDVFVSKRSTFLPEDTLTVRCRIWKSVGKMLKDVQCTACTHIGIEKRYLRWDVKNFSTLTAEKKCVYQVNSKQDDSPLISVGLALTEGSQSVDNISFELFSYDQTIKFCTLKLFLIDASGNRVECNREEFWFDDSGDCKFTFSLTKNKVLEEKSVYLLKDTLSLLWEWTFSRGVVSEETEVDDSGCICPEIKISDAQEVNHYKTDFLKTRFDNVKSLYDEHFLTDVKLKTNTGVFSAHKLILSASSSVFKAMFSNDMKEKDSNSVNIEDLDDETINRMLHFIYAAQVEDLTWENASRLYIAADKYNILSLRNLCSSYLKDHLSPGNSCEILLLSDLHADYDLKSAVQDYILKHGKQITNSDEWKALVENNAKLAVETLRLLFK